MKLNKLLDIAEELRKEVDKSCRRNKPTKEEIENLGWCLAERYGRIPKTTPIFQILITKFVIDYRTKKYLG